MLAVAACFLLALLLNFYLLKGCGLTDLNPSLSTS
jgi:hypothetical protein